jgi:hypothetical protein
VRVESVTASTATVSWRTTLPATGQAATGLLFTPTLWTAVSPASELHQTQLDDLDASTTYHIWLQATDRWRRNADASLTLSTLDSTGDQTLTADRRKLLLNQQPIVPRMVWNQCAQLAQSNIAQGINLFMGNACGSAAEQTAVLGDRALVVADAHDASATDNRGRTGPVGSFLPDEWDTHLPGNLTSEAAAQLVDQHTLAPRFLTLTNHFYSRAAPLPQGRGMYPALVQNADVLGFDLYPLQNWCRFDSFADVFDAQRELTQLAAGKPTYQWIEARAMDCEDEALDPTPETVRAETWLALAGGASAIGYFPYDWTPPVGDEINRTNWQIKELTPALTADELEATSDTSAVKVGARTLNGAIYLIAVNSSRSRVDATLHVEELSGGELDAFDEGRHISAAGDAVSDSFEPLEVHIYIAAPPNWAADTTGAPLELNEPNANEARASRTAS